MPFWRYGQEYRSQLMPLLAATFAGLAIFVPVAPPATEKSATSRTPVQLVQLGQFKPGRKFCPMHPSRVCVNAKVSPSASPEPWSDAAPPELVSMPWPHSCRNTPASSPVFEQPPPER